MIPFSSFFSFFTAGKCFLELVFLTVFFIFKENAITSFKGLLTE